MPAYFLVALDINDAKRYQQYVEGAAASMGGIKVVPLVIDDNPVLLEGQLPGKRIVLFEFESQEDIQRWHASDAYQKISNHRLASADTAFCVSLAALPGHVA